MPGDEHWKYIRGTARHYSISTHGRVRANTYKIRDALGRVRWYEERMLEPKPRADGREGLWCKLAMYGRKRQVNVARLVATHFLYQPTNKTRLVCMDGNPENCHLSNLEWRSNESVSRHNKRQTHV